MNINREDTCVKTFNKLQRLKLGEIQVEGWLKDQLIRSKAGMGGHLDELEPDAIATPHINQSYFKTHPLYGEVDSTLGARWSGEFSGCYWTGLIELAYTLQDKELINKATVWVNKVLENYEGGYFGNFPPDSDRSHNDNAWACAFFYRALLSYYEATGRKDVLDAVYGGCLWFCENWDIKNGDYSGPAIIEPMIVVYAYTGDEKLLDFCLKYIEWLDDNSRWQNRITQYLSDELPYGSMHVVAYGEDVKEPAIVFCANGDDRLLKASISGVKKALNLIIQATGGASSCSEFLSPKGSANETEYCNYPTFQNTYVWMAMATGDASWGDEIERAAFNGAQGARLKDEKAIAYFTSPNQLHANRESSIYGDWGEYGVYAPCYHVSCCAVHSVLMIPEYVRSMVMKDANDEIYLFCYGPIEVKTKTTEFTIETAYPFRSDIRIHVMKINGKRIHLRIPSWCENPKISCNGHEVSLIREDNGFAYIDSDIVAGVEIELHFPMNVELVKIDDSDAASKYPMVIERGPLVYSIPVPAKWTEYPGRPITPLPEGWAWHEASPLVEDEDKDILMANYNAPWMKAIDEKLDPKEIRVNELEFDGYVWENPPITIEVPLYHARYAYSFLSPRQNEPWGKLLKVEDKPEYVTMVPHGCTNLRITYIPRAKV